MEKERIEAGAALLHRLQRVTTLITHMKNLELYYDKELDSAAREFYFSGGADSPVDSTGLVPIVRMAEFGATWMKERIEKEQNPAEIAPNQFDGITYGMQGYSTEKPVERDLTVFEGVLDTFLFNFAHSPIEDCEPKEYIKKYSSEILKAAYKELQSELKHDLFEAKQEGRKEGYEVGVYETEQKQKPVEWSKEDEKMLNRIIETLSLPPIYDTKACAKMVAWLKSLRPQPKRDGGDDYNKGYIKGRADTLKEFNDMAWKPSEDEERLINTAISFLKDFADKGYENAVECIDWLKSKSDGNTCK